MKLKEDQNITLILPCTPTVGAEEEAKLKYLEEMTTTIEGIKVVSPTQVECVDIHPTPKGTKDLIEQINSAVNNEIVLEIDDVVSPLKYRLVEPVYKVGCRGCDRYEYTASL